MKNYKEYIEERSISLIEGNIGTVEMLKEDTGPTVSTAGVAAPDAKMIKVKRETFISRPCFVVDEKTYENCMRGKVPFKRWAGYIEDEGVREEVKDAFYKNKKILVKNEKTGAMSYLK